MYGYDSGYAATTFLCRAAKVQLHFISFLPVSLQTISFNELLHPLIDTCLRSDECWLYWMFLALFLLQKWMGRWRNKHKMHINEIRRRSRLILTNFLSNWGRVNLWYLRKRRGTLRTVPPKKRVREKLFFCFFVSPAALPGSVCLC